MVTATVKKRVSAAVATLLADAIAAMAAKEAAEAVTQRQ